jgi:glucose-6-phosphate isomerase
MKGMYYDNNTLEEMINRKDELVYEFYDMKNPETPEEVAYGTSITYPGLVGEEYFMTKGHFHTQLETAEVYYCLRGHGYMLMENPEGQWEAQEMKPGIAVYVPGRYAHRSINVSLDEPLVSFFCFQGGRWSRLRYYRNPGFQEIMCASKRYNRVRR